MVLSAANCSRTTSGHGLSPYSGDKEHNYVDTRSAARQTNEWDLAFGPPDKMCRLLKRPQKIYFVNECGVPSYRRVLIDYTFV